MRNIGAEERKVHLSGRKRKGKGSIRDCLWGECVLVNESLKRASTRTLAYTHTHTHTHTSAGGQMLHAICSYYTTQSNLNVSLNLLSHFLKADLPEGYRFGFRYWCANTWFKKSTGTNSQGQPGAPFAASLFDSWIPLCTLIPLTVLTESGGAQRFV